MNTATNAPTEPIVNDDAYWWKRRRQVLRSTDPAVLLAFLFELEEDE